MVRRKTIYGRGKVPLDDEEEKFEMDLEYGNDDEDEDDEYFYENKSTQKRIGENKEYKYASLKDKGIFKNRRIMAYISLFSILIITIYVFGYIPPEGVKHYSELLFWFFTTLGAIVITYMGSTVLPTLFYRNRRK